jgi:hypothetical protein
VAELVNLSLLRTIFESRTGQRFRSQWPRGLRRRSAAARSPTDIVGSNVCLLCCVLPGRGLCDELITRPEESYRLWCVVVCDLENS